jgi:hypothetical protein
MRKFMMLLTALTLCLTACHDDDEPEGYTPAARASRTVLVYMSGENNLTVTSGVRFLYNDLQEIIEGSKVLGADQRLLVFVDSLNTNSQQSSTPFIIEVHDGKARELYKYDHHFYASDPANFREVIDRAFAYAPADSYGLVLWGHATGWLVDEDSIASASSRPRRAYGVDYGRNADPGNPYKWMNITQMARALVGLPKLAFIFADCCNMMCAEVAYELRNCTEYLIGSPAEIPGPGAPYHTASPYFFAQTSDFYHGIVKAYAEKNPNYLPLSAIRTSEMESLVSATREILPYVATHLKKGDTAATRHIIYYCSPGGKSDNYNKYMYDMNDMILSALAAEPELYTSWHDAFNKAVVSHVVSPSWETMGYNTVNFADFPFNESKNIDETMGCVSMFFPLDKYESSRCYYQYNADIRQLQWYDAVGWSEVL